MGLLFRPFTGRLHCGLKAQPGRYGYPAACFGHSLACFIAARSPPWCPARLRYLFLAYSLAGSIAA